MEFDDVGAITEQPTFGAEIQLPDLAFERAALAPFARDHEASGWMGFLQARKSRNQQIESLLRLQPANGPDYEMLAAVPERGLGRRTVLVDALECLWVNPVEHDTNALRICTVPTELAPNLTGDRNQPRKTSKDALVQRVVQMTLAERVSRPAVHR